MRTTLNINDALLDEIKERARTEKRPVTKVINDVLRMGLSSQPTTPQNLRIPTAKVGIKDAYKGMSLNQLYDQIESEDHLRVAEE